MQRATRSIGAKVIAFPRPARASSYEWIVASVALALLVAGLLAR
jgi:hypothetical protein